TASRVALLFNPLGGSTISRRMKETHAAASALGLRPKDFEVRDTKDINGAFAEMTREHMGALLVMTDPLTLRYRARIVQLASNNRLPALYSSGEYAYAGGLIAYGPNVAAMFYRAATYVDRLLKGAKPGDLPVEQPTTFELIINLKTAKALGLTIPPSLLARA